MTNRQYSCTSNTAKLLKHLDKLQMLQSGTVSPIMVHMVPTHRCQMKCVHCCFKNRKNKHLDMPYSVLAEGIKQFHSLGVRSIELTGGGDPTLYPYINEALSYLYGLDFHIGMITNAIDSHKVNCWYYCDWVRVSLNVLDYDDPLNLEQIEKSGTYISFCYIWNERTTQDIFDKVVQISNEKKIVCRVAPDCICSLKEIDESLVEIQETLSRYKNNEFAFLSDFNISTSRKNTDCRIHMIKPCFYADGNIYSCPSSELSVEHGHQMSKAAQLCKHDEVFDFYGSGRALEKTTRTCTFCKYVLQQNFLEELLMETTFNEFA